MFKGCETTFVQGIDGVQLHTFNCKLPDDCLTDTQRLINFYGNLPLHIKKRLQAKCSLIYTCNACSQSFCSLEHFLEHDKTCFETAINSNSDEESSTSTIRAPPPPLNLSEEDINNDKTSSETSSTLEDDQGEDTKPQPNNEVYLDQKAEKMVDINRNICRKCSRKFSSNSSLLRHVAVIHLAMKRYQCPYCRKKSCSQMKMSNHLTATHNKTGARKELYKLAIDLNFKLRSEDVQGEDAERPPNNEVYLDQEATRMVDINRKICLRCDREFQTKSILLRHVAVIHLEMKRYQCPHCRKKSCSIGKICNHLVVAHNKRGTRKELYNLVIDLNFKLRSL